MEGKLVVENKNKAEEMLATIGIQPAEVSRILNLANETLSQKGENVNYSLTDDANYGYAVCFDLKINKPIPGA